MLDTEAQFIDKVITFAAYCNIQQFRNTLKELIKQLIFPPTETQECPLRTFAEIVNDLLFKKL